MDCSASVVNWYYVSLLFWGNRDFLVFRKSEHCFSDHLLYNFLLFGSHPRHRCGCLGSQSSLRKEQEMGEYLQRNWSDVGNPLCVSISRSIHSHSAIPCF